MSITPLPPADFVPSIQGYSGQGAFRFWCQTVLPLVYDDSLSYYELLNKVVNYLNNLIKDTSTLEDNYQLLYDAFVLLQKYVNTYFNSLDVQEEINNKLDQMVCDGTFGRLLANYLPFVTPQMFGAKGDGTTDDTDSIQAAIDAGETNNNYTLVFPKGTYLITKPLLVYYRYTPFWDGAGTVIRGVDKGSVIIIKNGTETYNEIDCIFYAKNVDSTESTDRDGSGITLENLTLKNESTNTINYTLYATGLCRSNFKNLTVYGGYGFYISRGYTNYYDEIIFFTEETCINTTATSNYIGRVGCFGVHNPYILNGTYSNANLLFGDNCTGTFLTIAPFGSAHVGVIGAESSQLEHLIVAGNMLSSGLVRTVTIDTIYCFNLTTENASYFEILQCRLKINAMLIIYQNTPVQTTLCHYNAVYGTFEIGKFSNMNNITSFNKNLLKYFDNKTARNIFKINSDEVNGEIITDKIISLGGTASAELWSPTLFSNNFPSLFMGGAIVGEGRYMSYIDSDNTDLRYKIQGKKGSLYTNDITRSTYAYAGYISTKDIDVVGNTVDNKVPIPCMYCCFTVDGIPPEILKTGLLAYETNTNTLKIYNNGWRTIAVTTTDS